MANCCSIVSLHLCKEYLTGKIQNSLGPHVLNVLLLLRF